MLRVLDLFSGIGGFSLGLERTGGFRTVSFCEIDPFPRKVLAKHWPNVPIFEDVRKLHAEDLPEPVDVICGGYPCQPFSLAGKRKGAEDDRHLWPEIARLLREFDAIGRKPTWCLFENVTGHVNMGLDQVLTDLESQDYTAWTVIIPACGVDAPHRRYRVWILAYDGKQREERLSENDQNKKPWAIGRTESCGDGQDVSDSRRQLPQIGAEGKRDGRRGDVEQHGCISSDTNRNACYSRWPEPERQQRETRIANGGDDVADTAQQLLDRCGIEWETGRIELTNSSFITTNTANARFEGVRKRENKTSYWPTEPDVGRVANGVPRRVDRLRALGNAVVPQVVEVIGRAILDAEKYQQETK